MRRLLPMLALLLGAVPLQAQLFSPGKLTREHASLEGFHNCTSCHELRQRGTSNTLCLNCHKPVAARIAAGIGLHATYGTQNCAQCHRDHLGTDHQLIALDTAKFVHDTTGFKLRDAHRTTPCRNCHASEMIVARDVIAWGGEHHNLGRTYLGLATTCLGCHDVDTPHGTQFARRSCDACHAATDWKEVPRFDHGRATFKLTGEHRTVPCSGCHPSSASTDGDTVVKFAGIPSGSCTACHQDIHQGAMSGSCTACHTTTGWHQVAGVGLDGKFDHSRTHFPLNATHAKVACATCHDSRAPKPDGIRITLAAGATGSFVRPRFENCESCHLDPHAGTFTQSRGGITCTNCHGSEAWIPTSYGFVRHNSESRFVLTGAHLTVPCGACHGGGDAAHPLTFRLAKTECVACHQQDDPHGGQFAGRTCESCHTTATFALPDFDHSKTRYPLDGAHRTVSCASCHKLETPPGGRPFRRFTPMGTTCKECHGGT